MFQKLIALLSLLLLAFASPALTQAQEPTGNPASGINKPEILKFLSGAMTKKEGKKFVEKLGVQAIQAAHPSGSSPDVLDYGSRVIAPDKVGITMSVEYYGGVTGRQYPATITIIIDASDRSNITVAELHFSDSINRIPANKQNLAALRKKLNRILED